MTGMVNNLHLRDKDTGQVSIQGSDKEKKSGSEKKRKLSQKFKYCVEDGRFVPAVIYEPLML